jgi:hypothetical protein
MCEKLIEIIFNVQGIQGLKKVLLVFLNPNWDIFFTCQVVPFLFIKNVFVFAVRSFYVIN